MEQRKYRTQYVVPDSGEAWNSNDGTKADNMSPETVLSQDDPYYELAMGKVKQAQNND